MSYKKQNFLDGQVLNAEHLNNIETGIADLESRVSNVAVIGEVTLLAANWTTNGNLHSQVVTLSGITPHSQVNLTPSVDQLVAFYEKDVAFVTENEDGVVTVYAIGQKPTNDYEIQVTITEVNV